MAYDYAKLNGKIVEKCGTQAVFAERMGLSERTISLKLNNKVAFKQPEIQKILLRNQMFQMQSLLDFSESLLQDLRSFCS